MTDREKFEAWCSHAYGEDSIQRAIDDCGEYDDGYEGWITQDLWEAWRAALASQQPADDGWIEWKGGECPVDRNAEVGIRYRDGEEAEGLADFQSWKQYMEDDDIIAYRVVKP